MKKARFYYTQLHSAESRALYKEIVASVRQNRDTVCIRRAGLSVGELHRTLYAVYYDHPEFFHVEFFGNGCYYLQGHNGDLTFRFRYLYPSGKQKQLLLEQEQFVHGVLSRLPPEAKTSEFAGALWLHDLLTRNLRYDEEARQKGADQVPDAFNVLGSMRKKSAVCAGVSRLYQLLCERLGIWCTYVAGPCRNEIENAWSERHAWNLLRLDGVYTYVDVTWDLGTDGQGYQRGGHAYFGLGDQLFGLQHQPDLYIPDYPEEEIRYPVCQDNSSASYYVRTGRFFRNRPELEQYVRNAVMQGNHRLSFQLDPGGTSCEELSRRLHPWMQRCLFEKYPTWVRSMVYWEKPPLAIYEYDLA